MNSSGIVLVFMVFTLGFRHGFDLDHLSTIDSITRTVRVNKFLSKIIGILFSLGHGIVVTIISLIIGSGILRSRVPLWLDSFGNWISIFFLFTFGFISLWIILQKSTSSDSTTSLKSLLAQKIISKKSNPIFIMLIGALFAFSFDTFSQVALFSISASLLAGWLFSGILGVVFMLGMMISDGINGLFISKLIQRADKTSFFISRMVGLMISVFSLAIGTLNLIKMV